MKSILSLLVVFVFLNVQSRAYSPNYGGEGLNPVGTYGGTLIPTGAATVTNGVSSSISLGLFSLGVPQTGLATGSFAVFIQGAAYIGQIVGFVDPSSQSLTAILSGDSTFLVAVETGVDANGNPIFTDNPIQVSGNMVASFATGVTATGTGLDTTISGTANVITFLFISPVTDSPVVSANQTFAVNGVQQSATVMPTTISLSSSSGAGTGGG